MSSVDAKEAEASTGYEAGSVATAVPSSLYARFGKRGLDIVVSAVLLVIAVPLILVVSVGVVVTRVGWPPLYRQRRIGRFGRPFTMLKIRTMTADRREAYLTSSDYAGQERRFTHKSCDDPRHTGFGQFLRKTSLDELPQLWNVLVGQMSLVGPRPEIAEVARRHGLVDHPRNLVRPGITGPLQIGPHRADPLWEHTEVDLAYLADVSLRRDLAIIAGTLGALVGRSGE